MPGRGWHRRHFNIDFSYCSKHWIFRVSPMSAQTVSCAGTQTSGLPSRGGHRQWNLYMWIRVSPDIPSNWLVCVLKWCFFSSDSYRSGLSLARLQGFARGLRPSVATGSACPSTARPRCVGGVSGKVSRVWESFLTTASWPAQKKRFQKTTNRIFRSEGFFGYFGQNFGIRGAEHHKRAILTQPSPTSFDLPSPSSETEYIVWQVLLHTAWHLYCPWVSAT